MLKLLLAILIALLAGLTGWMLGAGRSAGDTASAPLVRGGLAPEDRSALAKAIEELSRRVVDLGDELRATRTTAREGPQRQSLGEGEPASPSLEATLQRLSIALERGLAASAHTTVRIPRTVPHEPFPRATSSEDRQRIEREHLLMSYQDVLDRFGRPDQVSHSAQGIPTWFYLDEDGHVVLSATFIDGLLVKLGVPGA